MSSSQKVSVDEVAVDTSILVGANSLLTTPPRPGSKFQRRLNLLSRIRSGDVAVLISKRLLQEYRTTIPRPRNDFVVAFFKAVVDSTNAISNYAPWPGGDRSRARKCRYPQHDDHVLRTAWRDRPTTIVTEDGPMLRAGECIFREFRVRIQEV